MRLSQVAPIAAVVAVAVAGCGSSKSTSSSTAASSSAAAASTSKTSSNQAVNPNAPETRPPGDIPDTQVYVTYRAPDGSYSLRVPEGWSRKAVPGGTSFSANLNTVQVETTTGPVPAPAQARTGEAAALGRTVPAFKLKSVDTVARPAGTALHLVYSGGSPPDPVTGKSVALDYERYEFAHGNKRLILTVSSPAGSDNVDPWKKITSSVSFTR